MDTSFNGHRGGWSTQSQDEVSASGQNQAMPCGARSWGPPGWRKDVQFVKQAQGTVVGKDRRRASFANPSWLEREGPEQGYPSLGLNVNVGRGQM